MKKKQPPCYIRDFSSVSFECPPESKLFTRSQSVTVFVDSPPSIHHPQSSQSGSNPKTRRRNVRRDFLRDRREIIINHMCFFFFFRTTEAAIKANLRFNTSDSIHRRSVSPDALSSRRTRAGRLARRSHVCLRPRVAPRTR